MLTAKTKHAMTKKLTIEFDREQDGRWIAEVPNLPGVMAYGKTKPEARQKVYAVALQA